MDRHVVGIIPARLQSTRLPRKLLLADTGRPLIQHTWDTALRARSLEAITIATDSAEIAEVVHKFGGRCELTGEHPSGTDRIAELVRRSFPEARIIVNVQGDEPELDPAHIDLVVQTLIEHPSAEMSTLATPITTREVRDSPSCVKVVCAANGRALYFSRSVIPHVRDGGDFWGQEAGDRRQETGGGNPGTDAPVNPPHVAFERRSQRGENVSPDGATPPWLLHLGLYAYRRDFLLKLTSLPPSRLEQLEKLEQLRALDAGATIQVAVVDRRAVGIDTPEDYARFVERMRRQPDRAAAGKG